MDWMIWLVAGLFYLPLHLGLPAGWLFYRLLDQPVETRKARLRVFLREGFVLLALTVGLAAVLWQLQVGLVWLVALLVLASLLPFWRVARLSADCDQPGK